MHWRRRFIGVSRCQSRQAGPANERAAHFARDSYNRADELLRTVERSLALPEQPPVIVVDNGSSDGAGAGVAAAFPAVELVQLPWNIGAAARNIGVLRAQTPYVAFSDDDTVWTPGSLAQAVHLLDRYPRVAVLTARVRVGAQGREDPVCRVMARSPLPSQGLPGPGVLGFLAGASAMRREVFLEAGGYEPRFFIGGEEELLALDLLERGWALAYAEQLTVRHFPSVQRDGARRRGLLLRNRLWTAWMRRSLSSALALTARSRRAATGDAALESALREALHGLPWALWRRRPVSARIESWCALVEEHEAALCRAEQLPVAPLQP
jgi:GT2 family glycosyltransferase